MYQNSKLSGVINPHGWAKWNDTEPTNNVKWKEYGNSGTGAAGTRQYGTKASSPISKETFFGNDYGNWVDTKYLGGK
jgi:pectinesterase